MRIHNRNNLIHKGNTFYQDCKCFYYKNPVGVTKSPIGYPTGLFLSYASPGTSNLYFDPALNKLIAVCCDVDRDLRPKIDIYTLLFPPINELASKRTYHTQDIPNAIRIFGDFTITDRDGNIASDLFSQQSRTLLLLLLRAKDKGISSSRISGILWPDKEPDRARNSRGVAISNLRKAMEALDGISLTYEEGLYRIQLAEPCHLDYYDFKRCLDEGNAEEALRILSRGRFLKDMPNHVFDGFKSDVESLVIPFLTAEMDLKMKDGKRLAVIEIADMALEYDPQDELALKYSVAALKALGRRDDALVRYSVFQSNWQKLNDEPFPVKFDDLL